jgi:hypothetical protein
VKNEGCLTGPHVCLPLLNLLRFDGILYKRPLPEYKDEYEPVCYKPFRTEIVVHGILLHVSKKYFRQMLSV